MLILSSRKRNNITKLLCIFILFLLPLEINAQKRKPSFSNYFTNANVIRVSNSQIPIDIKFKKGIQPALNSFFTEFNKTFSLTNDDDFKLVRKSKDKLGETHYRYNQYYKGIEVVGAQYILHEKSGYIRAANGMLVNNLNLNVNPKLSEQSALNAALQEVNAKKYMWENSSNEIFLKKEQKDQDATFFPKGELAITSGSNELNSENCKLVYRFDIYAQEPLGRYYVDVDANTGEVVTRISRIHKSDVSGSGTSLYNGTVSLTVDEVTSGSSYRLQEHTTRSAGMETYDMHNGSSYGSATDITSTAASGPWDATGLSAHWGAELTFDYYLAKQGRNSFDDAGGTILSYVHALVNYNNAFWDGTRMTYGDGDGTNFTPLVSTDVTGHEISHGVTEYTSNLIYEGESGALNESFSDIFGNLIEFYEEGEPGAGTGSWRVGEDVTTDGLGIRNMASPSEFGDPDTYEGTYWVNVRGCRPTDLNDQCGVHTNSGVQNFWFYLLCEGGSGTNDNGDAYNVTGIGLDNAGEIAYRNNTVYLTPTSNYYAARVGAINAATDLFGAVSSEVQAVKVAWDAVGVYEFTQSGEILVWEGVLGGQDYSGVFINNYLTNAGYVTEYTNVCPPVLTGYNAVFLSFGNYGNTGSNMFFDGTMAGEVISYLKGGGKVYLEGGDALGYDQDTNSTLLNLFGLNTASDGSSMKNEIDGLAGQSGAITDGMLFNSSTQFRNNWIDLYTPNSGITAFVESGYGNVAVQNTGTYSQKTFCFSYALAELTDGSSPSTKDDLMAAILNFFELPLNVSVKVFLEGPYTGSGTMSTSLNPTYLPNTQPYTGNPWNYSGTESVASGFFSSNPSIVDWVLVDLRTGIDSSTTIARRAAFIKSDGAIVDTNGISAVDFSGISGGDYHIVIRHRSHLSIMSANKVTFPNLTTYDFTNSDTTYYGTGGAKEIEIGVWGMIAGDIDGNGQLKYNGIGNDRLPILTRLGNVQSTTLNGYYVEDVNMNGQVKYNGLNNDRFIILNNLDNIQSSTKDTQVPN